MPGFHCVDSRVDEGLARSFETDHIRENAATKIPTANRKISFQRRLLGLQEQELCDIIVIIVISEFNLGAVGFDSSKGVVNMLEKM